MRGAAFTWSNNRSNGVWARLDRFLISPVILSWFPNLVQNCIPRSISDHSAITLGNSDDKWGPGPFRFHNRWLDDKILMKEVKREIGRAQNSSHKTVSRMPSSA